MRPGQSPAALAADPGEDSVGQLSDAALSGAEQRGGRGTGLDPGAHPRQVGMCPPPPPALPIKQLTRLGGPHEGSRRFAGR